MPSGQYRHRIALQVKTVPDAQDSVGAPQEVWTNVCDNLPAAFEAVGGREFPESQKLHAEVTARFRIRYRQNIRAGTHRVVWSLHCDESPIPAWNILAVKDDGRRRWTELQVSEIR